jgi:amidase
LPRARATTMRALKWKSSEAFHPRKIAFLTGVKGKRIDVLRSFFGDTPIHQEVNPVANKAVEDLRRLGATVIELNTPDSDISVHLYELKPAINTYLAAGNAPVKSLEEIISSSKFHPNIDEGIKKAQSLELDDGYRLRLQKRAKLQQRVMKIMADDRLDAIVFHTRSGW